MEIEIFSLNEDVGDEDEDEDEDGDNGDGDIFDGGS